MQINGNVFIITGGASGLGAAVARMIASQGGRPLLADLQAGEGTKLAAELGGEFVQCDVTSGSDAGQAVKAAQALGPLRGLINCAGIAPAAKTIGSNGVHPLDLFQKVLAVNLAGSFNMARLAAAAMSVLPPAGEEERGVIINTASVAAFDGQMGQCAYAASKAGIVGMTLPMARDLARNGIRVMTIAPGIFETPLLLSMPQEVRHTLGQAIPFPQRPGKPDEFAHMVRSIIENPMLNGEVIRLDGAIRMQP
ncbi:MAG: family NAD(P)-dependent oxidoreductase, partial [Paucimonas sp.]|nr:family NAD(P)-dependent oxidoreductase [Paucimonas sp.]